SIAKAGRKGKRNKPVDQISPRQRASLAHVDSKSLGPGPSVPDPAGNEERPKREDTPSEGGHAASSDTARRVVTEEADTVPSASINKSATLVSGLTQAPAIAIPTSTEKFSLFPFPPRNGSGGTNPHASEPLTITATSPLQHVDIVVIHGMGGHWNNTWKASDGAIWPRLFSDTTSAAGSDHSATTRLLSLPEAKKISETIPRT
ncbi:hypothetical protein QBC37DRAFT_407410, partial [Rhypophila decipiens]